MCSNLCSTNLRFGSILFNLNRNSPLDIQGLRYQWGWILQWLKIWLLKRLEFWFIIDTKWNDVRGFIGLKWNQTTIWICITDFVMVWWFFSCSSLCEYKLSSSSYQKQNVFNHRLYNGDRWTIQCFGYDRCLFRTKILISSHDQRHGRRVKN